MVESFKYIQMYKIGGYLYHNLKQADAYSFHTSQCGNVVQA